MSGPHLIDVVRAQLDAARGAAKCHRCGRFQDTVTARAATEVGTAELGSDLERARACSSSRSYDCLGCEDCFPAIAANAFTEAHPEAGAGLALCPTEAPAERLGWPPLPGAYTVLAASAAVAVCTRNDDAIAATLAVDPPAGLAIEGTLHTENLGIGRLLRNAVANPSVRWLVLCRADTLQAIGHLPGQSLVALFAGGVDGTVDLARGARA
jgi:tetrahydromethanopterin S-methyltransferase subunit A